MACVIAFSGFLCLYVLLRPNGVVTVTCKNCFVNQFKYILDGKSVCTSGKDDEHVEILFLVFTVHGNIEARNAIRKTWLEPSNRNSGFIRYVFLLGQPRTKSEAENIFVENTLNSDIVMADFVDSYRNLTLKTIMGLQWATGVCSDAKVVVKTDDDMFINVQNLLKVIKQNSDYLNNSVLGSCFGEMTPVRNSSSKWYTSYKAYPNKKFPKFCSGTSYVTGMIVVRKLIDISVDIPFFDLEDVYIGMCLNVLKMKVKHIEGFRYKEVKDDCEYKTEKVVTVHGVPPEQLENIWNKKCPDKQI